jgi:HlyD family secretion protein
MRFPRVQRRTLALIVVIAPLLALFVYVALRSGPLAPVPITVASVEARPLAPALFGVGTVQARYVYKIGPTYAGRVKRVDVHVGEMVRAGQSLGEIDPVDLNERIAAQSAAVKSGEAAWRQAQAKQLFAKTQANRYERLLAAHSVSEEMVATKRQELAVADAALSAAREDLNRLRADAQALRAQRTNLSLIAPVSGLVVARDADPGTTVVAGQAVVELIDPASLWIDTRFDQISAEGLAAGLPAQIVLRSRHGQALKGRVLRVEPLADQVTEETLAKIIFDEVPKSLPPVGELAEVTLQLPQLPSAPTIPNAAIREVDGQRGVWKVEDGGLAFAPVVLGRSDLQGNVQVRKGLGVGDRVVVYSASALRSTSHIHVVTRIPGVSP